MNKERREETVELGFVRQPAVVLAEIERRAEILGKEGWRFVTSTTDEDLGKVVLTFERELEN